MRWHCQLNSIYRTVATRDARWRAPFLRFGFAFAVLSVMVVGLSSSCLVAQTVPDTRPQPAPWRPAFAPSGPAPSGDQGTSILNVPASSNQTPANEAFNTGPSNTGPSNNGYGPNPADTPLRVANAAPALQNDANQSQGNAPVSGTLPGSAQQSNSSNASGDDRLAWNRTGTSNSNAGSAGNSGGDTVRISESRGMLPNSAGQVWREYDITPYTSQITNVDDPQQAIIEWIRLETGTEMWFSHPLGILNADKDRLYVYHTPEIHDAIRPIVDRFVRTRGQVQNIDVNLCTVEDPGWRSQVYSMLQPIDVQSPGVEAWMISKENAAILFGQLSRRGDFKQHSAGRLSANEGQHIIIDKTTPVQFVRNLRWTPGVMPGYQPLLTSIDSGYRLSISTLSTSDGNNIEATIKCDVDQVEKLTPVNIEVPDYAAGRIGQMTINVPQLVSWRLHERFRWPDDQVLVLSCGVVARPDEAVQVGARPALFSRKPERADALLFIEYRGPSSGSATTSVSGATVAPNSASPGVVSPNSVSPNGTAATGVPATSLIPVSNNPAQPGASSTGSGDNNTTQSTFTQNSAENANQNSSPRTGADQR